MHLPLALANWKMAMTLAETRAFVAAFVPQVADVWERVDIVICPPFTALHTLAQALEGTPVQVGAQNLHPGPGEAFTGEVSAALLADAGAQWVLLGHWERRRHFGETDALVNRKVHAALAVGLRPILLVGEPAGWHGDARTALAQQLEHVLMGCTAEQVATTAFVYEPEAAIGGAEPISPEQVGIGCDFIRTWLGERFGLEVAQKVRIIYGGSVTPEHVAALLTQPGVDGLGAGRKGRDPEAFARIVRRIVERNAPLHRSEGGGA